MEKKDGPKPLVGTFSARRDIKLILDYDGNIVDVKVTETMTPTEIEEKWPGTSVKPSNDRPD